MKTFAIASAVLVATAFAWARIFDTILDIIHKQFAEDDRIHRETHRCL